jgi:predicted DNA-binding transcriptional regulator YafY
MSRRTVYRDLRGIEQEIQVPLWSENGRGGVAEAGLLPPLKLTLAEGMAVFLSARLMARYATSHDPDLMGAFQKLGAGMPEPLAEHVAATLDVMARRPADEELRRRVRLLTQAWAERRVVALCTRPGPTRPSARPQTAGPAVPHRAVRARPRPLPHRIHEPAARRTFKIERIVDLQVTADRYGRRAGGARAELANAWGHHRDQADGVVLRYSPSVAQRWPRRAGTRRSREPQSGGRSWRATVAGTSDRLWILSQGAAVEVLSPAALGTTAATVRAAAAPQRIACSCDAMGGCRPRADWTADIMSGTLYAGPRPRSRPRTTAWAGVSAPARRPCGRDAADVRLYPRMPEHSSRSRSRPRRACRSC